MTLLYHPGTGGEFHAEEKAVHHYLAGGWVVKADWSDSSGVHDNEAAPSAMPLPAETGKPASGTPKPAVTAGGSAEEN